MLDDDVVVCRQMMGPSTSKWYAEVAFVTVYAVIVPQLQYVPGMLYTVQLPVSRLFC